MPRSDFRCFWPHARSTGTQGESRLAQTRLVQLSLYLAVALSARADALPIEVKALDDQVVAVGLHLLLIDRGGSRDGRIGWVCQLRSPIYRAGLRQQGR